MAVYCYYNVIHIPQRGLGLKTDNVELSKSLKVNFQDIVLNIILNRSKKYI